MGLGYLLAFIGLVVVGMQASHQTTVSGQDFEDQSLLQGKTALSHEMPTSGPYLDETGETGLPEEPNHKVTLRDRIAGWTPSFRKGGKSGLGLKLAF